MRLTISHVTHYRYDEPVRYGLQRLRLTPKSRAGQTIHGWQTTIDGGQIELSFDDQHNNHVDLVSFAPGQREIRVHCEGQVDTTDRAGVIGSHGGFAPLWYFTRNTPLTKPGPRLRALAKEVDVAQEDVPRLHTLSNLVTAAVHYETGNTHVATVAEEALGAGHGVCQDHAQIFVSAARLLGYPARYVSGYLKMDDREQQDATHAWAEVHLDSLGWVGFDVSNGISPDDRYVRVATGLDYSEAAPVSGMRIGAGDEALTVAVHVQQQ